MRAEIAKAANNERKRLLKWAKNSEWEEEKEEDILLPAALTLSLLDSYEIPKEGLGEGALRLVRLFHQRVAPHLPPPDLDKGLQQSAVTLGERSKG